MSAVASPTSNTAPQVKVAFVLIDGLGDVSITALNNRTPLETATICYLDAVAAAGYNGLMDPVEPGLACGSDTSHLSIFGYDPRSFYRGRGAFESMGAGLKMLPGDIAFKSNFATLDATGSHVIKRRADRRFEEIGPVFCQELDGLVLPNYPDHEVSVKYATEHRCGVVVRGPGLTDQITGTDPLKDNLPLQVSRPLDESLEAVHTAAVVNELSSVIRSILQDHPINKQRIAEGKSPANGVLLRGCGSRIAVQPFQERHGMKACMVAPTKIIAGLGMSLGIDVLDVEGCTGDYRTQFHKKAEAISHALVSGGYDFGFLHVKAVDDTGHDRLVDLKVQYSAVVNLMVGQLVRRLWDAEQQGQGRFAVVVTGDHSTPVEFGDHSHEPVPFAIAHVSDVAAALGGKDEVATIKLGAIPHPHAQPEQQQQQPGAEQRQPGIVQQQNERPEASRRNLRSAGSGVLPAFAALQMQNNQNDSAASTSALSRVGDCLDSNCDEQQTRVHEQQIGQSKALLHSSEPAPPAPWGDAVQSFSEIAAAGGALGRFPGCQVMPLIRQFVGIQPCT